MVFRSLDDHPDAETLPGLLIMRTEGRMYFASVPRVDERLQELVLAADPKVVIPESGAIPDFEYTALRMLTESERKLDRRGITLWLVGANPEPFQSIRRAPPGQTRGDERMFPHLRRAISAYLELTGGTCQDQQ